LRDRGALEPRRNRQYCLAILVLYDRSDVERPNFVRAWGFNEHRI
jgi:hypothetical protein